MIRSLVMMCLYRISVCDVLMIIDRADYCQIGEGQMGI